MTSNERPDTATGNVMFHRRGVNLNVWLTGEVSADAQRLGAAWNAVDRFLRTLPEADREEVLREQQRSGYGGGRGGNGRADRFPVIEGYECDRCHGPVGRKAKKGGMRSDAVMCLGSCKEEGKDGKEFTYTVGWCDENGAPRNMQRVQGSVAKPADAAGPNPVAARRGGSSPSAPTTPELTHLGDFLNTAQRMYGVNRSDVLAIFRTNDVMVLDRMARDLPDRWTGLLRKLKERIDAQEVPA